MKYVVIAAATVLATFAGVSSWAFDQQHRAWDALLKKHVVWIRDGKASEVDYAGFQRDAAELRRYLAALSGVSQREFDGWTRARQLAFLINAYNAFTIELILTRYPDLESIKDLGTFFQSPWKKRFFTLLGEKRHLDDIEHGLIRAPGVYDEPRIHVAVVCASIGCPALRDEAFTAERLDAQLEDSFRRFLSDQSRNRYNPATGKLEVSRIFDWYGEDFSQGHNGFTSLENTFARYADLLTETAAGQRRVQEQRAPVTFLRYDWDLNDRRG